MTNEAPNETQSSFAEIREMVVDKFDQVEPDVLFVFSAGINKGENNEEYRSLSFSDLGEHGLVTGARTRVIAAEQIAKAIPELNIVTNSFDRFNEDTPTMASVVAQELVNRDIDSSRITQEENSFSTITQIAEMVRQSVDNGWLNIAVVTNRYHLPRTQAIYDSLDGIIEDDEFQKNLKKFKEIGGNVRFVCAEDVLSKTHYLFDAYMHKVEQTPEFQKTLQAEERGLRDLESGNYKVVLNPEKPRPNTE